jgi:hypothetical protein
MVTPVTLEADVSPSASVFGEADGDVPHLVVRRPQRSRPFRLSKYGYDESLQNDSAEDADIVRLSSILTQKLTHFQIR